MMLELVPATNGVQGPRVTGFYPINDLGDHIMGKKIVVEKGDEYGMLTAIRETEAFTDKRGDVIRNVEAECECGTVREYRLKNLRTGNTKSCGCVNSERFRRQNASQTTHNASYTRLYSVWTNMNHRCGMGKASGMDGYAGRGIKVCKEWSGSFEAFRDWAEVNGYAQGLQIDRIDNNGDYSPDNAHFIKPLGNTINRRNSLRYIYNGVTYESAREAANKLGLSISQIRCRCRGYNKRGKFIPPRPDCWAEKKYPNGIGQ